MYAAATGRMEEVNRVGDEDTVLVEKLAATARGRSLSRQLALEADLVGVLIVSEDLTTLSSLESLLEHASPYKCRGAAPVGPRRSGNPRYLSDGRMGGPREK